MSIKSKLFLSCFIGVLALFSFTFKATELSPFPNPNSSTLWKIEGKKCKESYLFGTMHMINRVHFDFPDELTKLISKSKTVVMELGETPSQQELAQMILLKKGTFFDYFDQQQQDTIIDWAYENLHMEEEIFRLQFKQISPFYLVQLATQLSYDPTTIESYELSIQNIVEDKKIQQIGLETFEEQFSIINQLTKEELSELVMTSLRDTDTTSIQELEQLYARKNVDSLFLMIQEDKGVISQKQKEFLDQRNRNWIPKITAQIQLSKTFIAVGAGHLGGQNGVIRLLEKEGYTLTPIKFKKK